MPSSETFVDSFEAVVDYYNGTNAYLDFISSVMSGFEDEIITIPQVKLIDTSIVEPLNANNVVITARKEVIKTPIEINEFLKNTNVDSLIQNSCIPNLPIMSVRELKPGSKVKITVGETFVHHALKSHYTPDLKTCGMSVRDLLNDYLLDSYRKINNPLLPTPLRVSLILMSRDGYLMAVSKKKTLSGEIMEISPISIFPRFPLSKNILTLSDVLKKELDILKGSKLYLYGLSYDFQHVGEVVAHVLAETNYLAREIKEMLKQFKPMPINIMKLNKKVQQFKTNKLSINRLLTDSVRNVSRNLKISPDLILITV